MDPLADAALTSWTLSTPAIVLLLVMAAMYVRGWQRGRKLARGEQDGQRLLSFSAGLALIFLATESPLDTFDNLFLSAHMTQHLLLMMLAPPLLLLGHPMLPLLRGLPKAFVKEGLGPFLTWPLLKKIAGVLVSPLVAWVVFACSTILWHLPAFYELALRSPVWHAVQHASFFWSGILFWWPVIEPGPRKSTLPLWGKIPYLLLGDIVNTAIAAYFVFSGRLVYPSYGLVRASSFSALDDQTVAGLIMWVPGSIVYLVPAFTFAMRLLASDRAVQARQARAPVARQKMKAGKDTLVRWRRPAQVVMLLVAVAVTAHGWFGPQMAPLNLAGVLPWIYWRALSVFALLLVGNAFCMACPFTLMRDWGRKVLPANRRWPRQLRNKWLPAGLLVVYLVSYEVFGLWDSPFATAWIIAGYFAAALVVDGMFRGASFCKYVCPIGQFHFVSSLVSPREVRVKSAAKCQTCRTHDCIRGNETARGCELYLFQPKKESNLDCTFCLDCVKACPHDNVALLPVLPGKTLLEDPYRSSIGRLSKRSDFAALAAIFVFGAFANAAAMVGPVMMWEHGWHARLGMRAMPLVVAAFMLASVVLAPALAVSVCHVFNRLATGLKAPAADLTRRLVFTLVPLGFAMWAAHLLFHVMPGWSWLTATQLLLLDAGLLLTVYIGWKIAKQTAETLRGAVQVATPWFALAVSLYGAGAWILFQPMQMRGMVH